MMRFLLYVNHLGKRTTNATAITILAKDLSNYLLNTGHEVVIVGNKDLVEEDINVPYYSLDKNGKGDINYAKSLAKVIKNYKPDIIHAFMKPMCINLSLSTFFWREKNAFYTGSFHNSDNFRKYGKKIYLPYRFLVKKLLERLDIITGPSNTILKDIKDTYFFPEKRLKILNNFINFSLIEKLSQEPIDINGDFIVNVGRLEEQKNQKALIRVFYKVNEVFPNLKLVIVGDGSLKEELINLSKSLNLEDKIIFTGYQNNPWKYIRRSKAFVLTSIFEGLPLVLIESMYLKVPILSFDIEPSKEITENGKLGILTKSFNEDELSEKIIHLLKNPESFKDMIDKAYKKSLSFSPENFVNQLIKYKEEFKK